MRLYSILFITLILFSCSKENSNPEVECGNTDGQEILFEEDFEDNDNSWEFKLDSSVWLKQNPSKIYLLNDADSNISYIEIKNGLLTMSCNNGAQDLVLRAFIPLSLASDKLIVEIDFIEFRRHANVEGLDDGIDLYFHLNEKRLHYGVNGNFDTGAKFDYSNNTVYSHLDFKDMHVISCSAKSISCEGITGNNCHVDKADYFGLRLDPKNPDGIYINITNEYWPGNGERSSRVIIDKIVIYKG